MFMFCRLAMMKEFLFMSGLEELSYTHPARAPHTHTHTPNSLRQARPPRWTWISSSAMMDYRYWWSCSLICHPHPLWHLLINAYTSSCERLLLFPSSVTVVSLALVLSLWAICLAWFSLSPFFFSLWWLGLWCDLFMLGFPCQEPLLSPPLPLWTNQHLHMLCFGCWCAHQAF